MHEFHIRYAVWRCITDLVLCLYSIRHKLSISIICWNLTLLRHSGESVIVILLTNYLNDPSEPPETHINDECDEDHCNSSHLGVRGAGVEVFSVAAILLRQRREIAGFRVESWRKRGPNWHCRFWFWNKWRCKSRWTFVLTGKCFSSLQYFLNICHHYPLNILELCVDAAQVPSGSAVNVCLLVFLDIRVWNNTMF